MNCSFHTNRLTGNLAGRALSFWRGLSRSFNFLIMILGSALLFGGCGQVQESAVLSGRIQPYAGNPAYWQYRNEPLLLLGGTSDHNLFQHTYPRLDKELDRMVENGGNYVRCVMSSREPGNIYPFYQDPETELFDLEQWNDEYWERFDYFLRATHERDIIVQVEIWASYDFYTRASHVRDGLTAWDRNPFNPRNNNNYTEGQSGLTSVFQSNGYQLINPFFNTTLPLHKPFDFEVRPMVLRFQQRFVDKLLSVSLQYDHVLYCIDNETNADPQWPLYWSQYIRQKAAEQGITIEVTEMWDTFDPTGGAVEGAAVQSPATHFFVLRSGVSNTLYDAENYSFMDISNHNAQTGETHYLTGLYIWEKARESGNIRPVNNVKIYGAGDGGWAGSARDALERFWRNIFAGAASVRFHRPPYGLGISDMAIAHIRSMRMLEESADIFSSRPSNHLLGDRDENEAFCLASDPGEYLLFFPSGGSVRLNARPGSYSIRWLDIENSEWLEQEIIDLPGPVSTPGQGFWAVRVTRI